jgi:hypothetical protein
MSDVRIAEVTGVSRGFERSTAARLTESCLRVIGA